MIKDITTSSRYMQVSGSSGHTYVNGYSGSQGVGNMRYNTSNQNMEVFDGNNWITLGMGFTSVGLTMEAESLLDWARDKRNEELAWENMAKDHPAVKNALDAVKKAREQLDLVYKLSKEQYEDTGVSQSP